MTPTNPGSPEDAAFDPEEIEAAANEVENGTLAPELTPETKNLIEWDQPPSDGAATPRPEEDEATVGEMLVQEGIEEAERVQRLAAADPEFEP